MGLILVVEKRGNPVVCGVWGQVQLQRCELLCEAGCPCSKGVARASNTGSAPGCSQSERVPSGILSPQLPPRH